MSTCLVSVVADACFVAAGEADAPPSFPVAGVPAQAATTDECPDESGPSRRWPSLWLFRPDALGIVRQRSQPVKKAGMAVLHKMDLGAAKARDGAKWVGRKTLDRVEGILDTPVTDCIVYPIGVVGYMFGAGHSVPLIPQCPRSD